MAHNIHVRRPPGRPANPAAYLEDPDFLANPLPDGKFDCQPIDSLFGTLSASLPRIRDCIQSIPLGTIAYYQLVRDYQPYLEIEENDEMPFCLKETLTKIPVPREMFFQSNEEGAMNCYSTRLDVEATQLGGTRTKPLAVKITFPPERFVNTDEDMLRLIQTWSLTPLWHEGSSAKAFLSRIVPDSLCVRCLGEKGMIKPWQGAPVHWPSDP